MVCHTDEKQYKCTYCPNEYKRSKDLKCHLNLHTGENINKRVTNVTLNELSLLL